MGKKRGFLFLELRTRPVLRVLSTLKVGDFLKLNELEYEQVRRVVI
ncbi:hypothetical protein VIBNIAM115_1120037 [Vibrio nigripulchritudo AM115]|nr:hypothetical protein VIBNIAM115_1120037 [Vibrio nigripulchritudo AM115]